MDVLPVYTCSQTHVDIFEEISDRATSQPFVKLYRDGLSIVGTIPPHLLQTITYLATQMNAQRQGYLSSWNLAKDLGISRETAISRLVELHRLQISGGVAATYSKVRRGWNKPVYYIFTLADDLPFAWDCSKSERPFIKLYIKQTRELIRHLEPELWATLLVMGLQMSSERLCRVSLERLSSQMGIATSSVSERLKRLSNGGWIERIPTPGNQVAVYRFSMSVPMGFGREEDQLGDLDCLDGLVSLDQLLVEARILEGETVKEGAVSGSPPFLIKIKRVKELTTERAGEGDSTRVVVKTPQKGIPTPKRPSRRCHVGKGVVGNEEKDSQGWKADSKNESCQVQDPSTPVGNEDRGGSEPVSEPDFTTDSQMDCQMDRAEIKELNRLCGRSNVQRWLATVGVGRLVEVYKASGSARRSRGGWIRKAIEENWMLESSGGPGIPQSGTSRKYGLEQPPETGAQFYRLDHRASTLRAAELAGIELDEIELDEYDQKTSQPVSVRSIRDLKSLLKAVQFSAEGDTEFSK